MSQFVSCRMTSGTKWIVNLQVPVGGTSAPILTCCGSWQGFISPDWTIAEVEIGRADGKEGVRVQSENVLVISGVMYDMLREV